MSDQLWIESEGAVVAARLISEHRCLHCRRTFAEPWLVPTGLAWPNNVVINAEIAWHWQDTHGFPAPELAEMVSDAIYRSQL